jgi:hypothetical protein
LLQPQFEIKEIRTVLCDNNYIFAGFQLLLVRIKKAIVPLYRSYFMGKQKSIMQERLCCFHHGAIASTIDEIASRLPQHAAGYKCVITM